ncbi:MAG TPA: ATP-binding cassette domain-containing protein, partial [Streptosporangiaceae bacterium]
MTYSIIAEGLVKRFADTVALDGIDLAVRAGSVFGLLGPNGAGKTTTVRILATLVRPDGGHAAVCGHDVVSHAHQVRQLTGLTGQYASVDETLTGLENLMLIGRLTGQSRSAARSRARDLLGSFRLDDAADRAVKAYSGGMRRRLDLAASLVSRPRVLYLDEPTTGLDPRSRNEMWDMVRGLTADGVTVLLTTQCLEEADQLADQIAVVDHGTVIATGTPTELKARTGALTLSVRRVVPHDQQRLVGQRGQQVQDLVGTQARPGADLLGGLQGGAPGEDREAAPYRALGVVEQVPAPVHHRAQRLVPGHRGAAAAGQQAEPVPEAGRDLLRGHGAQPGRGQLDGQRHAVERAADRGHRGRVVLRDLES